MFLFFCLNYICVDTIWISRDPLCHRTCNLIWGEKESLVAFMRWKNFCRNRKFCARSPDKRRLTFGHNKRQLAWEFGAGSQKCLMFVCLGWKTPDLGNPKNRFCFGIRIQIARCFCMVEVLAIVTALFRWREWFLATGAPCTERIWYPDGLRRDSEVWSFHIKFQICTDCSAKNSSLSRENLKRRKETEFAEDLRQWWGEKIGVDCCVSTHIRAACSTQLLVYYTWNKDFNQSTPCCYMVAVVGKDHPNKYPSPSAWRERIWTLYCVARSLHDSWSHESAGNSVFVDFGAVFCDRQRTS